MAQHFDPYKDMLFLPVVNSDTETLNVNYSHNVQYKLKAVTYKKLHSVCPRAIIQVMGHRKEKEEEAGRGDEGTRKERRM